MKVRIGIFFFLLVFLAALFAYMEFRENRAEDRVTVFAASSFAYVLSEERAAIENAAGIRLVISEAASSTLARQIAEGAPADIFISADEAWLEYLADKKLFLGEKLEIAQNSLVLAFPLQELDRFCKVRFFAAPSAPELLSACPYSSQVASGDPAFVPLGKFAAEALKTYDLPLDLVPAPDARAALALLETGATAGAILYASDAKGLGESYTTFRFPEDSHEPIGYFAVTLKQSNSSGTENFLAFLKSNEFKTILRARGFEAG